MTQERPTVSAGQLIPEISGISATTERPPTFLFLVWFFRAPPGI